LKWMHVCKFRPVVFYQKIAKVNEEAIKKYSFT
jgi:hypothetical protein